MRMGDLVMDDEFLAQVENDLGEVKNRLYEPLDDLRAADASAVGEPELVDKVDHFKNKWDHSIDKMCEGAENAKKQLEIIRAEFAKIDASLAAALGGR